MFLKILKFSHFTWIINFNKFKFYPKQHYIKKKNLIYNYNNIFFKFSSKIISSSFNKCTFIYFKILKLLLALGSLNYVLMIIKQG